MESLGDIAVRYCEGLQQWNNMPCSCCGDRPLQPKRPRASGQASEKKVAEACGPPSVCEAKMEATNESQLCRRKVDGQKFKKKPDISTTEWVQKKHLPIYLYKRSAHRQPIHQNGWLGVQPGSSYTSGNSNCSTSSSRLSLLELHRKFPSEDDLKGYLR